MTTFNLLFKGATLLFIKFLPLTYILILPFHILNKRWINHNFPLEKAFVKVHFCRQKGRVDANQNATSLPFYLCSYR